MYLSLKAHAVSDDSYCHNDLRHPRLQMDGKQFSVAGKLTAPHVKETLEFRFENEGLDKPL